MNEHFKEQHTSSDSSGDSELVGLIKKMQQHLNYLEKKIDTLLSQSAPNTFQERRFSKPFRPGNHFRRPGQGGHGGHSGERSFSHGRPFDKPRGDSQGFSEGKKRPFRPRRDRH